MWINGPFPCGRWPDISIFRDALLYWLSPGERVEADDGYVGESPRHIKCPASFTNPQCTEYMQQRVRSRQETINLRFKFWGILAEIFRHDMTLHGDVLRSVAAMTQIAINLGEPLFECGYNDPPFVEAGTRLNTGYQRRNAGH